MIPHKHAEVLRAIADGVPLSEFEVRYSDDLSTENRYWFTFHSVHSNLILGQAPNLEIRQKPQYIMVNGFKVPKPLDTSPIGAYFTASPEYEQYFDEFDWSNADREKLWLSRGLIHSTKEAAIAHAKAMLGIDPKWEEA